MIGDTAPPLSLVAMATPDLYVHTGSAARSRVAPTLRSLPSASAATRAMIDGVHELPATCRRRSGEADVKSRLKFEIGG